MIKCEKCGANTTVVDTRHTNDEVYRNRKCKVCGAHTYTIEYAIENNEQFKKVWAETDRHRKNEV